MENAKTLNDSVEKVTLSGNELIIALDGRNIKIPLKAIKEFIGVSSLMQLKGAFKPTTPAPPEGDFWGIAAAPGVYANLGGFTLPANSLAIVSRVDGVISNSVTEIEPVDISGLAKESEIFGTEVLFAATLPNAFDNNGNPATTTSTNQTPPIPMKPGDRLDFYVRTSGMAVFFYDVNNTPISGVSTGSATAINFQSSAIAPAGTAYAKVKTLNVAQGGYQPAHFYARVYGLSGKIGKLDKYAVGAKSAAYQALYKGQLYEARKANSQLPDSSPVFWTPQIELQKLSKTLWRTFLEDTVLGSIGLNGEDIESVSANRTGFLPVTPGGKIRYSLIASRNVINYYADATEASFLLALDVGSTTQVYEGVTIVPPGANFARAKTVNSQSGSFVADKFYLIHELSVTMEEINTGGGGGGGSNLPKNQSVIRPQAGIDVYKFENPVDPLANSPIEIGNLGTTQDSQDVSQQAPVGLVKLNWSLLATWNMKLATLPNGKLGWVRAMNTPGTGMACMEVGKEGVTFHAVPSGVTDFTEYTHEALQIRSQNAEGNTDVKTPIIQFKWPSYYRWAPAGTAIDGRESWIPGDNRPLIWLHTEGQVKGPDGVTQLVETNANIADANAVAFAKSRGTFKNKQVPIKGDIAGKQTYSFWDGDKYAVSAYITATLQTDTPGVDQTFASCDIYARNETGQLQLALSAYSDRTEVPAIKLTGLNAAPATATSPGKEGDIRYTADYIYVCIADNTWKRTALETW